MRREKGVQKTGTALVLIILGLIVLVFPVLGLVTASVIYGFIILLLGIGLVVAGLYEMGESATLGTLELLLGIIALFLGVGCIFNPELFSWVLGFLVWITGLFLVFAGIIGIFVKAGGSRWNGVAGIVIGLLFMAFGHFMANPVILGILIGLWLLITGIMVLVAEQEMSVPEF
jgi:membrane protein HdeD